MYPPPIQTHLHSTRATSGTPWRICLQSEAWWPPPNLSWTCPGTRSGLPPPFSVWRRVTSWQEWGQRSKGGGNQQDALFTRECLHFPQKRESEHYEWTPNLEAPGQAFFSGKEHSETSSVHYNASRHVVDAHHPLVVHEGKDHLLHLAGWETLALMDLVCIFPATVWTEFLFLECAQT